MTVDRSAETALAELLGIMAKYGHDVSPELVSDIEAALACVRADNQDDTLREALQAARAGIQAVYEAGWDNVRRDVATAAIEQIDAALAAGLSRVEAARGADVLPPYGDGPASPGDDVLPSTRPR